MASLGYGCVARVVQIDRQDRLDGKCHVGGAENSHTWHPRDHRRNRCNRDTVSDLVTVLVDRITIIIIEVCRQMETRRWICSDWVAQQKTGTIIVSRSRFASSNLIHPR